MSDQPPNHDEQPEDTLAPLDEAFLSASRLRMVGDETSSLAAGMTEDVIGHAGLADMVQQVTEQLGAAAHEVAGRMEQNLHTFVEAREREDGSSGNG